MPTKAFCGYVVNLHNLNWMNNVRGLADYEDPDDEYVQRQQPRGYTSSASLEAVDVQEALAEGLDPYDSIIEGPWGRDPHSDGMVYATSQVEYDEDMVDPETIKEGHFDREYDASAGTDAEGTVPDNLPRLKARSQHSGGRSGVSAPIMEEAIDRGKAHRFRLPSAASAEGGSGGQYIAEATVPSAPEEYNPRKKTHTRY